MSDDLFSFAEEQARARNTDPAESHKAAAKVNVSRSHSLVLAALDNLGSATDERVYAYLRSVGAKVSPSRARSARAELQAMGRVVRVGTGTTDLGNECGIWATAAQAVA